MNNRFKIWVPIFIGLSISLGIFIGNFIAKNSMSASQTSDNFIPNFFNKNSKIQTILDLIDAEYVEDVNIDSISEKVIPEVLAQLDPHSVYIPAKDLEMMTEDLEGSFSGIGVQFNIQNDTVMVIQVINGGPSSKLGVQAGDRIVYVDDSLFIGDSINNEKVMKRLRGEKGSKVKLGIMRKGSSKILNFVVTRGDVPLKSVDIFYMIRPEIGYIKVSSFGAQTYNEFIAAISSLNKQGAKEYLVDLRGNPGGYLDAAISMINEFLKKDDLIVYTEGKSYPRKDAFADGTGSCQKNKLVVLIDEWSASASEIFAGAMQDNDRAKIVGRRSFGKGLVQQQIPFSDGSAVRLTVARYYTPSGRCIQKPYTNGDSESYQEDILNRYLHGEFTNKDSIKHIDTVQYKTKNGRIVYGGGGVTADVFVPRDTDDYTPYFNKVVNEGYIYDFAFKYTDSHRNKLESFGTWEDLLAYMQRQPLLNDFAAYVETEKGFKQQVNQIVKSSALIERMLYSYIARDAIGDEAFYPIYNLEDNCIKIALKELMRKENKQTAAKK